MRVGFAPACPLVERLVVPEPQRVDAEQAGCGLPDRVMKGKRADGGEVLPEVDALLERLLIGRALRERSRIGVRTRVHGPGDERREVIELGVGEQALDDDEAVARANAAAASFMPGASR